MAIDTKVSFITIFSTDMVLLLGQMADSTRASGKMENSTVTQNSSIRMERFSRAHGAKASLLHQGHKVHLPLLLQGIPKKVDDLDVIGWKIFMLKARCVLAYLRYR
mmetsp:Transcript_45540/g.83394  ORF Transcript_45540/g.83394 Transcript_45540/m.83394 type:complete len:106 (+) Transcript_45540:172-489(+)